MLAQFKASQEVCGRSQLRDVDYRTKRFSLEARGRQCSVIGRER